MKTEPRKSFLRIRLTKAELEAIREGSFSARSRGGMSDFVRQVVFGEQKPIEPPKALEVEK
jgi:hypothetical protein